MLITIGSTFYYSLNVKTGSFRRLRFRDVLKCKTENGWQNYLQRDVKKAKVPTITHSTKSITTFM
jgi:hypothetical protein